MQQEKKASYIKHTMIQAAKFPFIYFIIGIILFAVSYTERFFPLAQWKDYLSITTKIASLFFALALATFAYNIVMAASNSLEKKLAEKHKIAALVFSSIIKSFRIIFILIMINLFLTLVGPNEFFLNTANNIISILIICAFGWVAIQTLYTIEASMHQYMLTLSQEQHVRAKTLYTKMRIIRNIGTVIVVIITIAVILMSFNSVRNIGISLLASAGFITAIIGLSAQKTLFSLFSGLQIIASQSIKIGDLVSIENNVGVIEEITFTFVTLKITDGHRLIIPINYFVDRPFENWSKEQVNLRNNLVLYVDYRMPIEPLRTELNNILQISPYWDKEVKKLQITNLNDRAFEVRIFLSAANPDNLGELLAEVREKLLAFMQKNYPGYFPTQYTFIKQHEIGKD